MENKLQELTDKLYKEGLSKGKEEGEAILAKAKIQAEEILAAAKKEAEGIVRSASKEAEEYKTKVQGDVKMASLQILQATKKDIENFFVGKLTDSQVKDALSSADFVKEAIMAVASNFSDKEAADLEAVLPETLKDKVGKMAASEITGAMNEGLSISFSKKVAGGFTIGPKDGSYFIGMTEETFKNLIGEYLRPATRKILFGE